MLKPLNGRVLIKPDAMETQTKSGILLQKSDEKPVTGVVVVGNDEVVSGDKVLFSKFGFDEVKIDNELHYVVSGSTILAIL